MKLLINPAGGMAGDMFAAALVSAGADFNIMQNAMQAAGNKLGTAQIHINQTPDGSSQLFIKLDSQRRHLGEFEAKEILRQLFDEFSIRDPYREFGMNTLDILAKAEKRAHAEYHIVIEDDHSHSHEPSHHHHPHSHDHHHDHDHNHNHDHSHNNHHHSPGSAPLDPHNHAHTHIHDHPDTPSQPHSHPHSHAHTHEHPEGEQAFLHEAQDIVIDIMGAVTGLQQLDIEPNAVLLHPVSVGGGQIHFSHGTHSIPAPATTVILEEHRIPWKKGPIEKELFTPTGAALLAALGAKLDETIRLESLETTARGKARGTKILDIPPLELFIYRADRGSKNSSR